LQENYKNLIRIERKKMKKILVVTIMLLSVILLTSAFAPANQETLTIAARGGSHVDAMEAVKGEFETANNVKIEILGLESADLKQKIGLDSVNKTGQLDLIMIDDPWMPEFAESGIMANLTEMGYVEDEDFAAPSRAIGKDPYGEGDVYALPYSGNVMLFFYNKDLFDSKSLSVPTDWKSVLDIAKQMKSDGKIGYVIRGQQGNPIVTDYLPILWSFGGNVFDADWNVTINSPEAKAALELYMELLANGVNYEKNDIVAAVSEGKAAMSLGWPSWYISGADAKAAYAPIPGKVDADSELHGSGMIGNWMMAVTTNSHNKELALEFLKFVTSAENQKIEATFGGVPTRASVLTDPELTAKYPYFPTLLEATNNSVVRPRTPLWSNVETALGTELSSAISGVKTVDQALTDAAAAITAIMAE
jgi:multiple sugar transport system substrate-binding protein